MAYTKKLRLLKGSTDTKDTALHKVQMSIYLHRWVRDALDERIRVGEIETLTEAIEEAVVNYYKFERPKIRKKI